MSRFTGTDYKHRHYRRSDRYDDVRSRRPLARPKVMGVCAGLADQFGWDVTFVRIVAMISLFLFTAPTFLAYIVAGALFY
ncbi:MAG: PspC domain-containing protein [Kangiellaceae bacterium]